MSNDPNRRYVSRKDLAHIFSRSPRWVEEVTRSRGVANYGGRYDPQEVAEVLRAGYRPFSQRRKK